MDLAECLPHAGETALDDAALFGRQVVHVDGLRLGRVVAVVHQLDGERLAVVRRGGILRRWYFVALSGAAVVDGEVIVTAGYGRGRPPASRAPTGQQLRPLR